MNTVRKAIEVACEWHGEQRYGRFPYVVHLNDVAKICEPFGETAEVIAYLHDALEDTELTGQQVEDVFGSFVRLAVEALTDPPGLNRKERKAASYAKLGAIEVTSPLSLALVVKAADRLANVRACVHDKNERLLQMYRDEHEAFTKAVLRVGLNEALVDEVGELLAASPSSAEGST